MNQQQTWYVVAAIIVATLLLLMIALTGDGDLGGSPRDGQGMSPDTITTIVLAVLGVVGTLVGSFGGVWWGQRLEDKRRRRGEVRREVSAWVEATTNTAGDTETRTFDMRFFNDRDVNIALWEVQVEYYREGSLIDTIIPRPAPTQPMGAGEEVEPINLESRKSVYISLQLVAEGEELSLLKSADQLQFVATMMPDDEKVSKPLPAWDDLEEAA
jgi:hypothetical protein